VGAIAGLTKSGIRTLVGIVSYTPLDFPAGNVLRFLSSLSELVIGVLITVVISNIVLGESMSGMTPDKSSSFEFTG
jgi:hypothetical protein